MFAPRLNSRPNGCVVSLSSAPCKHHVLSADSHRQTHGLASFGHNSLGGAAIDMLRRRISGHVKVVALWSRYVLFCERPLIPLPPIPASEQPRRANAPQRRPEQSQRPEIAQYGFPGRPRDYGSGNDSFGPYNPIGHPACSHGL